MIIYVVGFLIILILYFNVFKRNIIKEGLTDDNEPTKQMLYDKTGKIATNCTIDNYKKTVDGKDAFACPTGNCVNVYGKNLFDDENVPVPTEDKIVGQCCPYVYENSYTEMDYENKDTCNECGYRFWDISGENANDPDIKACFNEMNVMDTSGTSVSLKNNIIKQLVDLFTPSGGINTKAITTAQDITQAKIEGDKNKVQMHKNNTVRQLKQLQKHLSSGDPTTQFQQQIMGQLDVIPNSNTLYPSLYSNPSDNTIGSPWKYPLTSMVGGDIDINATKLKCLNGVGVRSPEETDELIVERRRTKQALPGPTGIDSAWVLFKQQ